MIVNKIGMQKALEKLDKVIEQHPDSPLLSEVRAFIGESLKTEEEHPANEYMSKIISTVALQSSIEAFQTMGTVIEAGISMAKEALEGNEEALSESKEPIT